MLPILAHAADIAFSTAALVASVEIVYCRDDQEETIEAIAGSQQIQQMVEYDNAIVRRWRESFLVKPADLVNFGEPQPGDKVKYCPPGRPDIRLIFTLRPDDANGQAWRPTDRFHSRWRLNTVLTGKEDLVT